MVNIHDVAKYTILRLLQNGNSVSPLKLQKIMYYLQAWFLVYFNDPLFEEEPEAWVNGPVYRVIFDEYKYKGIYDQFTMADLGLTEKESTKALANLHQSMILSDQQWALVEQVLTHYGSMSQDRLVFLTHSQKPWNEAREGVAPFAYSEQKISFKSIRDYYSHAVNR